VKVEVVRVDAFIASLKVAVTVEFKEIPVAVFVGITAVICGAGPVVVVKDHV
jgi:hypothetical protein